MIIWHRSRPLFRVGCTTNRGVDDAHHLRRRGQLLRCARKFRPLFVVRSIAVGGVGNAKHLRRGMGLPRCSMDTLLHRFATLITTGVDMHIARTKQGPTDTRGVGLLLQRHGPTTRTKLWGNVIHIYKQHRLSCWVLTASPGALLLWDNPSCSLVGVVRFYDRDTFTMFRVTHGHNPGPWYLSTPVRSVLVGPYCFVVWPCKLRICYVIGASPDVSGVLKGVEIKPRPCST